MPISTFSIRTTQGNINLSSQGEGQLVFSVHNRSTKAILPARAQIETDTPQIQEWISFVGGDEKDFAVEATQQFQVRIKVPHGAIAGKYSFRLSMIGIESPDEHFTQGPSISFVTPETKVEPIKSRFPWFWIYSGISVVLIVTAILFVLVWINKPEPKKNILIVSDGTPFLGTWEAGDGKILRISRTPDSRLVFMVHLDGFCRVYDLSPKFPCKEKGKAIIIDGWLKSEWYTKTGSNTFATTSIGVGFMGQNLNVSSVVPSQLLKDPSLKGDLYSKSTFRKQ